MKAESQQVLMTREFTYRVWDQRHPLVIGRSHGEPEYGPNIHSVGVVRAATSSQAIQAAKTQGLSKNPLVRRINGS